MAPDGLSEIERSLISKILEPFAQISAFPHSSSENPMISGLSNFIRISFGKREFTTISANLLGNGIRCEPVKRKNICASKQMKRSKFTLFLTL